MNPGAPNRRTVLTVLGLGLVGAGCGTDRPSTSSPHRDSATPGCVLTPQGTEGPYYVDTDLVRRDISENKPGIPLTLRVTVVDASSCRPLPAATVDIWHADADGTYSGIIDDSHFLRGIQSTNGTGTATFSTIFPGWYDNRTAHIHLKVHVGGREIHTGQLYFDDDLTATIAARAPYSHRTEPRTHNNQDFLFRRGADHALLAVTGSLDSGYQADITVGVTV
ncbi:intradiol ring-cleavage dioxygenase [Nocardia mangyaensis]|uniref:intradiol ring-cleavage dioxygenase n=1 Tax=Nocardia mangyaensis TaxID=2213200 RepID=UPI002675677B|nr:intradiol ring-cleavage dioxygenase [Nocardia mangyaensis]MDO3650160.1 intradiol ring-cleavage dioxygenase [Nocardia mangyaensis]